MRAPGSARCFLASASTLLNLLRCRRRWPLRIEHWNTIFGKFRLAWCDPADSCHIVQSDSRRVIHTQNIFCFTQTTHLQRFAVWKKKRKRLEGNQRNDDENRWKKGERRQFLNSFVKRRKCFGGARLLLQSRRGAKCFWVENITEKHWEQTKQRESEDEFVIMGFFFFFLSFAILSSKILKIADYWKKKKKNSKLGSEMWNFLLKFYLKNSRGWKFYVCHCCLYIIFPQNFEKKRSDL